ncbi:30S ribosomal protein S3 [Candidatus Woesearchaeota archaeon]|nr:30S ribosomal protein S3 [Candidatus Woesearchaeota archaeon]
MIEREFVKQKKREFQVKEFISSTLKNVGHSYTELQRTPLGEKIVIHTSRPGLIVGRKGQNISQLTETLRKRFSLENPQVEISEVEHPDLDSQIVAERIAYALERFGSNRFKGIMHRTMSDVLAAGAKGVEIRLSGKLPGARAKSWRIFGGYLKKCGDAAIMNVSKAIVSAKLKSGVIGIQVRILPPGIIMPDAIRIIEAGEAGASTAGKSDDASTAEKSGDSIIEGKEQESKAHEGKTEKTQTKEQETKNESNEGIKQPEK